MNIGGNSSMKNTSTEIDLVLVHMQDFATDKAMVSVIVQQENTKVSAIVVRKSMYKLKY
jgi:hypothetical protein